MTNPKLWDDSHRHNAIVSEILEKYKNRINWRGKDTLIDIGCAGGGVTVKCILPILPSDFERLIGVDISDKMISYAREKYSQPKIEFKRFDTVADEVEKLPQVDHVMSSFCFHWIHDQKKALQNIYDMLKPGGDCLLIFVSPLIIFRGYEPMARNPKWSKYIKDVDKIMPAHQNSKNPEADFAQLMKECNFSKICVESQDIEYVLDDINNFKGMLNVRFNEHFILLKNIYLFILFLLI